MDLRKLKCYYSITHTLTAFLKYILMSHYLSVKVIQKILVNSPCGFSSTLGYFGVYLLTEYCIFMCNFH